MQQDLTVLFTENKILFLIITLIFLVLSGIIIFLLTKNRKKTPEETFYEEMDGTGFEAYAAGLLEQNGFEDVRLTPKTADFGVDIFAEKDGITYAFQCKLYDRPVGTKAVQEIYSGRDFFHCMVGVVLTNQSFTSGAQKLAEAFNILLWDDEMLAELEKGAEK